MKLSKIYKNQIWTCKKCFNKLSPETIILSPFSLDVIKLLENGNTNILFIDKKGLLNIKHITFVERSNFNKMLICPICKEKMLFDLLMQLSPNTKNKEKNIDLNTNKPSKLFKDSYTYAKRYFNNGAITSNAMVEFFSDVHLTNGNIPLTNNEYIRVNTPEELPETNL